jgi:DNA polymerase III subunit beta
VKIKVQQEKLASALARVAAALSTRPTHPILANVLVEAGEGGLSLTAFDLSIGIRSVIREAEIIEPGRVTVPGRLLRDLIAALDESTVTLAADGDDRTTIVSISNDTGDYRLQGEGAAEYPAFPVLEEREAGAKGSPSQIDLETESLLEALGPTIEAAARDETKQVLTGVHFTCSKDRLELAATDGHRLAIAAVDGNFEGELELTVPARALETVIRTVRSSRVERVTVERDGFRLEFGIGDTTVSCRLLEGKFPSYRQLLPKEFERGVTLSAKEAVRAIDRLALLNPGKEKPSFPLALKFDAGGGTLTLSTALKTERAGVEAIDATGSNDIEIAFNARYLKAALRSGTGDRFELKYIAADRPALVVALGTKLPESFQMLMPMQLPGSTALPKPSPVPERETEKVAVNA